MKGEFELQGKAVDISGLRDLGDAGLEIIRALEVATGYEKSGSFLLKEIENFQFLLKTIAGVDYSSDATGCRLLKPSDVLGQAAIDAAMDGATIVFEGDAVPSGCKRIYGSEVNSFTVYDGDDINDGSIVAYKLIEETLATKNQIHEQLSSVYDDLRDSHLELIRENMEKDKEIELLKQQIKDIKRAINDAKAVLDV